MLMFIFLVLIFFLQVYLLGYFLHLKQVISPLFVMRSVKSFFESHILDLKMLKPCFLWDALLYCNASLVAFLNLLLQTLQLQLSELVVVLDPLWREAVSEWLVAYAPRPRPVCRYPHFLHGLVEEPQRLQLLVSSIFVCFRLGNSPSLVEFLDLHESLERRFIHDLLHFAFFFLSPLEQFV